jgi:glycosyltransferase involved in cell wall biosynthesis
VTDAPLAQLPDFRTVWKRRLGIQTHRSILIISPWSRLWSLAPGAGVSDESQMLPRLIAHGYTVHMLVPRAEPIMPAAPGLVVHTFADVLRVPAWLPAPIQRLWLLPAFWGVAGRAAVRLARRLEPSLVMGFSHYGAWPAWRAGRACGAPSVLKLFGVMHAMRLEWNLPRYLYHSLEGVLAFKVPLDHFILLNDGTRGATVARRWGVAPERITWLPNGIDLQWAQQTLQGAERRRRFGAPEDAVVVLSLSRLVLSKRVDRIIQAMQLASHRTPKRMILWVAGDGPLRRQLRDQAREAGVDAVFLGTVDRTEIPHLLDAADMLVSTSILTNMSIPTCEAMVTGTPVVAVNVGGTSEVVRHEETGLLVAENDPEGLAEAVRRMSDDASLRLRLGRQAQEFALRTFMDWDQRVGAEIRVLDALVDGGASGRHGVESSP